MITINRFYSIHGEGGYIINSIVICGNGTYIKYIGEKNVILINNNIAQKIIENYSGVFKC